MTLHPDDQSPPFDWQGMEEDARARGDVCIYCSSALFGPLYGHASVTCASCGRPWRTRRMEQMDRDLRERQP